MHPRLIAVALLMTLAGSAMAQSPSMKLAAQKGWLDDYAAARNRARQTGKPMLVVFRCDP